MEALITLFAAFLTAAGIALTPAPLAGRTIVIDPGHNGANAAHPELINKMVPAGGFTKACNTTGTATRDGSLEESELNWTIATRLKRLLKAEGARVVMTRRNNNGVGPCVNKRAAVGNRAKADAVVSIHADGNDSTDASGFHVIRPGLVPGYTDAIVGTSRRLSIDLRDAMDSNPIGRSTYIGERTGLDTRKDLGGLNLSKVPIAMIEMGNMHNASDARLMRSERWRESTAREMASGLKRFFGVPE